MTTNLLTIVTKAGEVLTEHNISNAFKNLQRKGFMEIDATGRMRLRIASDTALTMITNPQTEFSEASALSYLLDERIRTEGAKDSIIQLVQNAKQKIRDRIQTVTAAFTSAHLQFMA